MSKSKNELGDVLEAIGELFKKAPAAIAELKESLRSPAEPSADGAPGEIWIGWTVDESSDGAARVVTLVHCSLTKPSDEEIEKLVERVGVVSFNRYVPAAS